MKTLFSIFVSLLIAASSIALAMNAQQEDPLCLEPEHEGFIVEDDGTPPPGSSPENLPGDMESAGIFEEDFECEGVQNRCHWVYKPAEGNNPAKWVECKGNYIDLRQTK